MAVQQEHVQAICCRGDRAVCATIQLPGQPCQAVPLQDAPGCSIWYLTKSGHLQLHACELPQAHMQAFAADSCATREPDAKTHCPSTISGAEDKQPPDMASAQDVPEADEGGGSAQCAGQQATHPGSDEAAFSWDAVAALRQQLEAMCAAEGPAQQPGSCNGSTLQHASTHLAADSVHVEMISSAGQDSAASSACNAAQPELAYARHCSAEVNNYEQHAASGQPRPPACSAVLVHASDQPQAGAAEAQSSDAPDTAPPVAVASSQPSAQLAEQPCHPSCIALRSGHDAADQAVYSPNSPPSEQPSSMVQPMTRLSAEGQGDADAAPALHDPPVTALTASELDEKGFDAAHGGQKADEAHNDVDVLVNEGDHEGVSSDQPASLRHATDPVSPQPSRCSDSFVAPARRSTFQITGASSDLTVGAATGAAVTAPTLQRTSASGGVAWVLTPPSRAPHEHPGTLHCSTPHQRHEAKARSASAHTAGQHGRRGASRQQPATQSSAATLRRLMRKKPTVRQLLCKDPPEPAPAYEVLPPSVLTQLCAHGCAVLVARWFGAIACGDARADRACSAT